MICEYYENKASCFTCPYPDCIVSGVDKLHKVRKTRKRKLNAYRKIVFQYDAITGKFIKSYSSIRQATMAVGGKSTCNISCCVNGKTKTAYGFKWSLNWRGGVWDAAL